MQRWSYCVITRQAIIIPASMRQSSNYEQNNTNGNVCSELTRCDDELIEVVNSLAPSTHVEVNGLSICGLLLLASMR